jgi:hypothetical protein
VEFVGLKAKNQFRIPCALLPTLLFFIRFAILDVPLAREVKMDRSWSYKWQHRKSLVNIARQFTLFTGVGFVAAAIHYGILILLVEKKYLWPKELPNSAIGGM